MIVIDMPNIVIPILVFFRDSDSKNSIFVIFYDIFSYKKPKNGRNKSNTEYCTYIFYNFAFPTQLNKSNSDKQKEKTR